MIGDPETVGSFGIRVWEDRGLQRHMRAGSIDLRGEPRHDQLGVWGRSCYTGCDSIGALEKRRNGVLVGGEVMFCGLGSKKVAFRGIGCAECCVIGVDGRRHSVVG